MPNTITFKHAQLSITVRDELGSDIWDEETAWAVLDDAIDGHPLWRVKKFIKCAIRTESIEGDLPFTWPSSVADKAMIQAYEGWRALSSELLKKWDEALSEVIVRPGDKDLHPLSPGKP